MKEKVLVTGAAGFIGSHLVEALVKKGYMVRAFVHYNSNSFLYNLEKIPKEIFKEIEIIQGDVTDAFTIDNVVKECEYVFHLAALIGIPYSYVAPAAYVNTNIVGTLNILEACRKYDIKRMIHTSTSETYGTAQYVPIDEDHPLVGQSPYSASKIAADKLVESYWLSFKYPATIIRPFNTYGPRQSMRAIIPTVIGQALSGNTIRLGSLLPVRDFTYAEDTANGFIAAINSKKAIGKTINLGYGDGISIGDLVNKVQKILSIELEIHTDDKRIRPDNSEVMKLVSNNNKAKKLMGWSPKINLEEGLTNTVEYMKKYLKEYKVDKYNI